MSKQKIFSGVIGIIFISFFGLSSCRKDFHVIEPQNSNEIGILSEKFTWNTTHQIPFKIGLADASLGDVKCRLNINRIDPEAGMVVIYSGTIENGKAVNINISMPTAAKQVILQIIRPDGSISSKEMEVANFVEYTFTDPGGKSGLSIDDADDDGVADILDDFPSNPDYAYSYSYPKPSGFGDGPLTAISWATYCFEDLWPSKGDFDMNDLVINYNWKIITDANHFVKRIDGHFKVKASGACSQYKHGFGVALTGLPSTEVQNVTGFDITGSYITLAGSGLEKDKYGNMPDPAVIIPFDNFDNVIHNPAPNFFNTLPELECGTSDQIDMVITLKESTSITDADIDIGNFNAFLIRNRDRAYEIHKVDFPPTSFADPSLFGRADDASNPGENTWYRSHDNLPWALDLPIDFNYPSEYVSILHAYPQFKDWAQSSGTANQTWYLHPTPAAHKIFSCEGTQPPSLQTGLVAYYPFNGNANDESGNGNNGVATGATLTTDRFETTSKAYYFSSSGCSTRIDADINTTSITTGMSLSFWIMRMGSGCISPRIIEFWPGSDSPSKFTVKDEILWHNYSFGFSHLVSTGDTVSLQSNIFPDNQWVHFTYTNDGISGNLYENGQLIMSKPSPGLPILAGDVAFGRMNHSAWDAFDGKLDEIRIYNRAITPAEVEQLFSEGGWVNNQPPVASNVGQSGTAQVGEALIGNYEYSDPENDLQGTSTYKWYHADDATGTNEAAIAGATALTYTLDPSDEGKYIRFAITPVAQTGASPGTEVKSTSYTGPIIPTLSIGQSYQGGIIFYIDNTGQHGLIAATSDQGNGQWGCSGTHIGTSHDLGSGHSNTIAIVTGCSQAGIAARICNDLVLNGYDDWFLPSHVELNMMYTQKNVIGGLAGLYWSSTEHLDATVAFCKNFSNFDPSSPADKTNNYSVRAIRAF